MKILVLSDTHGKIQKVCRVFEKLNNIDMIIHCGDYYKDGETLEDLLGVPVVAVKGNCDGALKKDINIVESPAGNILVTHGHSEGVNYDYTKLLYEAEENNCIAVCFGHTHIPVYEDFNGIYLVNPGSLTSPRDGTNGSYAIIQSTDEDFCGAIVYYDTLFKSSVKKKVTGGYIRSLINYSDRF